MKVNVDEVFYTLEGNPLYQGPVDPAAEDGPPPELTLGFVAIRALLDPMATMKMAGDEKYERFDLSKRIHAGGTVEMSAEEIALVKEAIAKTFASLVVGRAWDLLEGRRYVEEGGTGNPEPGEPREENT